MATQSAERFPAGARRRRAKRLFDLVLAVVALVLSLPVQAVTAVAVAALIGRPVLFRQVRPGLHGAPFVLVKFRTMLPVDVARGQTDDASRMTGLGRVLRSTSLDELPTLWNVVRGEMSLVGPRPLLMQYLDRYTPQQARRHEVLPGLTGLAQVSGRNGLSWDRKFALDIEYVDRCCMSLDLGILLRTVRAVVRRDCISGAGAATMTEFLGERGHAPTARPAAEPDPKVVGTAAVRRLRKIRR
jgi:lipopolysaccharide/colanic/teichoic acid biosynthesis glycosyltransferase